MGYWFEDPTLKALAPLALSSSIRGLSTIFGTPKIYAGFNVIPEGPVIGPSTMDTLENRCAKKRAFIVTDEFNVRYAKKLVDFLESGGSRKSRAWPRSLAAATAAGDSRPSSSAKRGAARSLASWLVAGW